MASGEDSQSGGDTAKNLGTTLVNQLSTAANTPAAVFDKSLYAGMGSGTDTVLKSLVDQSYGYQPGLDAAFKSTSGLATNGALKNADGTDTIPGLSAALAAAAGIAKNGVATGDYGSILSQYDSLYNQANKPTASSTYLTPQLADLSQPSYADNQAKSLYQGTLAPSFAQQGYEGLFNQLQAPSFAENGFQDIYSKLANNPTTTETNLGSMAAGSLVGNNPYLDAALKTTRDNTLGAVNSAFSSSGRLGSGLNISTLGNTIDGQENQSRLAQYNQDVQNQMAANSAIEGAKGQSVAQQEAALQGNDTARNNRFGLQTQALAGQDTATNNQLSRSLSALSAEDQFRLSQLGALTNTTGAIDTSNNNLTASLGNLLAGKTNTTSAQSSAALGSANAQLGAAGMLANTALGNSGLQINAANALGGQMQNALAPGLTRLSVGQAYDANSQAKLAAENDLFNRQHNAQLNQTTNILGALTGAAQTPGVAPETPWWQQALGYVGQNASNALKLL